MCAGEIEQLDDAVGSPDLGNSSVVTGAGELARRCACGEHVRTYNEGQLRGHDGLVVDVVASGSLYIHESIAWLGLRRMHARSSGIVVFLGMHTLATTGDGRPIEAGTGS